MNRKRIQRICALTLATAMALGGLAGCGDSSKKEEADTKKEENAEVGETGESDAAEEKGGIDHSEEITVTMMVGEAATQEFPTEGYLYDLIKEKFNINLVVQPIGDSDFSTKQSATLASGNIPDILGGVTSETMLKYASTGMFLNLTEYKDIAPDYFELMYAEDRVSETHKVEWEGNLYGFQKCEYNRIPVASAVALRMDLLEEQDIPVPTTFEEYYDALLKIKEKHPDMYGFSSRNGTNYLIGSFAYAMGSGGFPLFQKNRGIYYEPKTDSYIYGPTSESFKEVVEFLHNAYEDGLLDPDYATMSKDDYFEKLSSGKMMSIYDNNSFVGRVYNPALKEIDENAYFDILDPMADAEGNVRSYRYEKDWPNNNSVISSRTEYPERIVELMNWMYTEEGIMATNFGEEGTHYTVEDDGTVITSQTLIDEVAGASDVAAAVRGKLGLGLQGLAQYVDESLDAQITDPVMVENGERISEWTKEGVVDFYPQWPTFTEEETSRITELESSINNVFDQEIDGYITGKTSMDEWDSLVEKLKAQGTEELEEIFNEAYSRIK